MNKVYMMSSSQKRIYALYQVDKNSINYNIPLVITTKGSFDYGNLQSAFKALCKRHEPFRTSFDIKQDKFLQIIHEKVDVQVDFAKSSIEDIDKDIEQFVKSFDLSKAPLIRMKLIDYGNNGQALMIDTHHIIFDGTSSQILLEELDYLYKGIDLPDIELQFKDYAAWHNSLDFQDEEKYWNEQLGKITDETAKLFPVDFAKTSYQSFNGKSILNYIDNEMSKNISKFCKDNCFTENTIFLTTLMILLAKYNYADNSVVGIPTQGRSLSETENMIGMFVNSIFVHLNIDKNSSIIDLLQHVHEASLNGFENQEYPFELIAEKMKNERDFTSNPVFNTMFSYEIANSKPINIGDCSCQIYPTNLGVSKFDLTLTVKKESNLSYLLHWEYNTDLYKEKTIEQISRHFRNLLNSLINNASISVAEVSCISFEEKRLILNKISPGYKSNIRQSSIISTFEEIVDQYPNNTAIIYDNIYLTYEEVNNYANNLAKKLKDNGVKKGDVVGLQTSQTPEMIIGIIAILKTGGVYLPIELDMPIKRVTYMLEECKVKNILYYSKYNNLEKKDNINYHYIDINNLLTGVTFDTVITTKDDPVYIIYTSGSTGKPKGVLIKNEGLSNLVNWQINHGKIKPSSVILQKSTFIFDASIWEVFSALLTGAAIQLLTTEEQNNFLALVKSIKTHKTTHMLLIPSFFNEYLNYLEETQKGGVFDNVQRVYVGAEALSLSLIEKFERVTGLSRLKLTNLYGPTEGTVVTTYYDCENVDSSTSPPIGKPINNVNIYIMDDENLLGVGMVGEICFSGKNVSPGYINNIAQTNEKFKFNAEITKRIIYRTGDLGRWLSDGNVEYLGRIDQQIKIRGHRIELEEISSVLMNCEGVKAAITTTKKYKNYEKLVAYVITEDLISPRDITKQIGKILPDYMIPDSIIIVDKFPKTPSGKIDYKSLPLPMEDNQKGYVPPVTEKEKTITGLLKTILNESKISMEDNFLQLGGDSIKAIRFSARMREYHYQIDIRSIMNAKSVKEICLKAKTINDVKLVNKNFEGKVQRSPIQEYFYKLNLKRPNHFNQSMLLNYSGEINKEILKRSFNILLSHHDMLRMTVSNGEQYINLYRENTNFSFYEFNISGSGINFLGQVEEIGNSFQSKFSLAGEPLIKVILFKGEGISYVWIICHHLIVDAVSWNIIIDDLNHIYTAIKNGEDINLQKTTSYLEWVKLLKEYSLSYASKKDLILWQNINKILKRVKLFPKVDGEKIISKNISFSVPILKDVYEINKYGYSFFHLVIAITVRSIKKIWQLDEVPLTIESHGREDIGFNSPLDRTVGWFTSMYPIVIKSENDFNVDLYNIKEIINRVPLNGLSYGVLSTFGSELENITSDVSINYLGEVNSEGEGKFHSLFNIESSIKKEDISEYNAIKSPLTINCYVMDGKFNFDIFYHNQVISDHEIQSLKYALNSEINVFTKSLDDLYVKTASDYGELEWSNEEFTSVITNIESKGEIIDKIIPLTNMQQGMLYSKILDPDSTAYIIQTCYCIDVNCDLELLKVSFELLCETYSALRTSIFYRDVKIPRQVILSNRQIDFKMIEVCENELIEDILSKTKEELLNKKYDFEKDSLFNVVVIVDSNYNKYLIINFHHIIMDGWCLPIIINKTNEYYNRLFWGESKEDISKTIKKDFVLEPYIREINKHNKDVALDYWKNLLKGFDTQGKFLSSDYPKYSENEVEAYFYSFTEKETKDILSFISNNKITANTLLELAWALVLQRLFGVDDVVFGKVVSGRNENVEGLIDAVGLFINTIPVRIDLSSNVNITEMLQKIQEQSNNSSSNDFCPLYEIQKTSSLGENLINSTIVFENYDSGTTEEDNSLFNQIESYREQTIYPVALSANISKTLNIKLMVETKSLTEYDANIIIKRLCNAIRGIVHHNNNFMNDIKLVDENEYNKILMEFNNTSNKLSDKTVINLFEEAAKKNANEIAVSDSNNKLTYTELSKKVNNIAQFILEKMGDKKGVIGVIMDRSAYTIPVVYGIMKAGYTFLPIMPTLPLERIEYMLKDSNASLVITEDKYIDFAATLEIDYISCYNIFNKFFSKILFPNISGEDNAYIVFTSGTTGKPKGVMVKHKALSNMVQWQSNYLGFKEGSILLEQFAFAFDGGIPEYFSSIIKGGLLEIIDDEARNNFDYILSKLKNATVIFVPSYLTILLDYVEKNGKVEELLCAKQIGVAGEVISVACARKFLKLTNNKVLLHNFYGPTEATVCSTAYTIDNREYNSIPIGRPIANVSAFIKGKDGNLCGIGMPGELCIGGYGLSEGYINNKELTGEVFTSHPLDKEQRIYHTGDSSMWMKDGNIRYIGRIDTQVKIRGLRIEVDEIASKIKEIPEIIEAIVVAKKIEGDITLVAYFTSSEELSTEKIEGKLKQNLPEYMIPKYYVRISKFEVTPSGKINIKDLPNPYFNKKHEFIKPKGETEEKVATCFKQLLELEKVGATDDFFKLGGHSLKATQLSNLLRQAFRKKIPLSMIMESRTVREIARQIDMIISNSADEISATIMVAKEDL
ncbi:non-ribosomal peptide synthetase [Clostridium rectalis]|uniref:non-ribosomal peptide synthetase n=1 Tax=Clostridium rectalis TaxID=2040295 RepID=UPI000F633C3E|nr:non-ribosomal peptide synthetase [Clostridium rectalis]